MPVAGGGFEQACNDKEQGRPMLERIAAWSEALGKVSCLLAESGFYSAGNVQACEAHGIDPLIAVKRDKHHPAPWDRFSEPTALPEGAMPAQVMGHKLKTQVGRVLYALRKQTVEPVFGLIKSVLGFWQFSLRRISKGTGEWARVCLAWNLKRRVGLRPQQEKGHEHYDSRIKPPDFDPKTPDFDSIPHFIPKREILPSDVICDRVSPTA